MLPPPPPNLLKLQEINSGELENSNSFLGKDPHADSPPSPYFPRSDIALRHLPTFSSVHFLINSLFVVGPSTDKSLKKALIRMSYLRPAWFTAINPPFNSYSYRSLVTILGVGNIILPCLGDLLIDINTSGFGCTTDLNNTGSRVQYILPIKF